MLCSFCFACCFFFIHTATSEIYTLSLYDALPISIFQYGRARFYAKLLLAAVAVLVPALIAVIWLAVRLRAAQRQAEAASRSEEHTSELQSHSDLVCRLLLEKKKRRRHVHTDPGTD